MSSYPKLALSIAVTGLLLIGCSSDQPVAPADELSESGGARQTVTGAADIVPGEAGSEQADSPDPAASVLEIDDPWLRLEHVREFAGDLDGMIERGVVRLLVVPDKTFYFLDGARERGIVPALARELKEALNASLKTKKTTVEVVAIPVRRDEVIPLLLKGGGDLSVANWTATEERLKLVDFVDSGIRGVRELIVVAPNGPDLERAEDLSGMNVWVRKSSSYHESLRLLNHKLEESGKPPVIIQEADEILQDEDLLEMVSANLLPATVIDSHRWDWLWSKIFPKLKVNNEVFVRDNAFHGPMIRKNSPQFHAFLEEFAAGRRPKSAWFNTVLRQYYLNSNWIVNVAESSERRKYEAVVDLFRQYGGQYSFDYLMLIAQGYTESKLDQNARSHVGAIGVMQLMPATAAGPPVRIPNVDELDPNIHAGVKYLRYVVDQYFNEPEIDDVNKLLFAFASYNAGPNRIARLRKQTAESGLDPNQWFNNVERIVAGKVGREPVQYVRRIYKYYVAYRRLQRLEAERQASSSG